MGRNIDRHAHRQCAVLLATLNEHADFLAEQLKALIGDAALVGVFARGLAFSIEYRLDLHGTFYVLDEALEHPLPAHHGFLSGTRLQFLHPLCDAFICFHPNGIAAIRFVTCGLVGSVSRKAFRNALRNQFLLRIFQGWHWSGSLVTTTEWVVGFALSWSM